MVWCTRVQDCIYSPIINDNLARPFVLSSDTEVSLNTNCKHVQRDEHTIDFNWTRLSVKKEGARSRTISSIDLCKQFELKRENKSGDNIIDSIMLTTLPYLQTWTDAFLAEQESHVSIGAGWNSFISEDSFTLQDQWLSPAASVAEKNSLSD